MRYVRDERGTLVFHALPEPSATEVAEVAARTAQRVGNVLERHGRSLEGLFEGVDESEADALADEQLVLASCYGAAAKGLGLFGPRAGQPTLRLVEPGLGRPSEPVAEVMGFNVHAKVAVDGRDRKRVERLCRYLARPPIAQDRLTELDDGRLRYTMKAPWSDGTVALVFEPLDLIARLCALVPPPGFHMVRYHGVLSSHAALRPEVVPEPVEDDLGAPRQLELLDDEQTRPVRKPWAWLIRHVYLEDVSTCPECSGPMRWLEVATSTDAAGQLLARHGLGPPPPAPRPRAPPSGQLLLPFGSA